MVDQCVYKGCTGWGFTCLWKTVMFQFQWELSTEEANVKIQMKNL